MDCVFPSFHRLAWTNCSIHPSSSDKHCIFCFNILLRWCMPDRLCEASLQTSMMLHHSTSSAMWLGHTSTNFLLPSSRVCFTALHTSRWSSRRCSRCRFGVYRFSSSLWLRQASPARPWRLHPSGPAAVRPWFRRLGPLSERAQGLAVHHWRLSARRGAWGRMQQREPR